MQPIFLEPLSVERLTIKIPDLLPSLQGTKLVQLSDLHYDGKRLSDQLLMEAIEVTNQEKPDLVVMTGDFITSSPTPVYSLASFLQRIQSRCGTVACLGNHDHYWPFSRHHIVKAFSQIQIQVLWNAIAFPLGPSLPIVGLADFWSKDFAPESVFQQLDPKTPRLVLSHNPDTAIPLQQWRVDLQLSGHTHGGQIAIPGWGSLPAVLESLRHQLPPALQAYFPMLPQYARVVQHWQWNQGYFRIGHNQLYVNRGLGSYFPGRFHCPPEVTVITLIRDNH